MQEPTRRRARFRWLGVLGVVLLLGIVAIAGRGVSVGKPAPRPAALANAATPQRSTRLADAERFQIPVTRSQPSRGPSDAIVTIVEWCDLRAGACAQSDAIIEQVLARSGESVRRVFRHFAQPTRGSQLAHQLARIAHEQAGKFWQARALLSRTDAEPTSRDIERYTEQLGLDPSSTRAALDRGTHAGHVTADRVFAQMFGVDSVPAVFVNGRRLEQPLSLAALKSLVNVELAHARELVGRGVPKEQVYAELTKNGTWRRPPTRSN
jgi:protein-disulfide isomerase